jgi:hypothetical protein
MTTFDVQELKTNKMIIVKRARPMDDVQNDLIWWDQN